MGDADVAAESCAGRGRKGLAALAVAAVLAGCGGGGHPSTTSDAASDFAEPSLDQRITALSGGKFLILSVGDLDGDGTLEIVMSSSDVVPTSQASRGSARSGSSPAPSRVSALIVPSSPVLLLHDSAGDLVVAASNSAFDFAKGTIVAATDTGGREVAALQAALRDPGTCMLVGALVDAFAVGIPEGVNGALGAADSANQFLMALLGVPPGTTFSGPDFLECLTTGQTPAGCAAITGLSWLAGRCDTKSTSSTCALIATRSHCYQVSDGTSPTTCSNDNMPESLLCDSRLDATGCCNADFVFNTILPSSVQNVAPMPLSSGPIVQPDGGTADGGILEFLGGPPVDVLHDALKTDFPTLGALTCLVSGIPDTRNPIRITLDRDVHCVTNTTQPGHMLDGKVTQCIGESAIGVHSNIRGEGGPDARLGGLNEKVGPLILAKVRDSMQRSVMDALGTIQALGLCCDRGMLLGGTAVYHDDGSLTFESSGAPAACHLVDGGADSGDGGVTAAGGPDTTLTKTATLTHGQMVPYTFMANAGNGVEIRATRTSGNIVPTFQVHDPSGAIIASGSGASFTVTGADFVTKTGGTFTVDVYDTTTNATASGDFRLVLAVAPGADSGGALIPGKVETSSLAQGALDSYTFAAGAGQGVQLRLTAKTNGFGASFTVYDPSGAVAVTSSGASAIVGGADFSAKTGGVYTLILSDGTTGRAGAGPYDLFFTLAPAANEGTQLVPGVPTAAMLAPGGLNAYTFDAQAGQAVQLRVAEQYGAQFTSTFAVYGPSGALVTTGQTSSAVVSGADFSIKTSGTHTVVAYDGSTGRAGSGPYIVYLVLAPGTVGTALSPGVVVSSQLAEGALDAYTFTAQVGNTVSVHPGDADGGAFPFTIYVYDPSGKVAGAANYGPVTFAALSSGTFTIVVYDGTTGRARTGPYSISFSRN